MKRIITIVAVLGLLVPTAWAIETSPGPSGPGGVTPGSTINPGVLTAPAGSAGTIAQYSVNNVINPMSPAYGAKGDGVTDDSAAICNAALAVPSGGELQFPPNETFFVNSNNSGFYGCKLTVPMTIDFQGSAFLIGTGATNAFFGFAKGVAYTSLTSYLISNAHRGDTAVTLTTNTDSANFTVGHVLFIHGEVTDNLDRGENVITAINSGTGVISLQYPLGKDYTSGTPGVSDGEVSTIRNITIKNARVSWVGSTGAQFVDFERTYFTQLINNKIDATNLTSTEPVQGNASIDVYWTDNQIISASPNGGGTEVGGQGSVRAFVKGNSVSMIGTGALVLGSCEGCESMRIEGNNFQAIGSGTAAAMAEMSGSYDSALVGNHFVYGAATIASGRALIDTGTPAATNLVISDNVIVSYGPNAIEAKGLNDIITGNTITSAHTGIDLNTTNPAVITGNTLLSLGSSTGIGINLNAAQGAESSTITGNTTSAVSGNTCPVGIKVADPGAETWPLVITGNQLSGCTATIQYSGSAKANLTNICAINNGDIASSNPIGCGGVGSGIGAPMWARNFGDGNEGPVTTGTEALGGTHFVTTFNCNGTLTSTALPSYLAVFATQSITLSTGCNLALAVNSGGPGMMGGQGGTGGGGAAAGATGFAMGLFPSLTGVNLQTYLAAPTQSGIGTTGFAGAVEPSYVNQMFVENAPQGWLLNTTACGGGTGSLGGSAGGARGNGATCVAFIAPTITIASSGVTLHLSGTNGVSAAANSTGAGGGGGGGVLLLAAQTYADSSAGTYFDIGGGSGGSCTGPAIAITNAVGDSTGHGGFITVTGVTGGGLDATKMTLTSTGAGYTKAPICTPIVNSSGLTGTPACHTTISAGAIASVVVDTAGTGATFTAFTGCGVGGDGSVGLFKQMVIQ